MDRAVPLIRLVIVERDQFLRLGLKAALESGGDIEVIGEFEATDGMAAAVGRLAPDIVLMSTGWPAADALTSCRKLRSSMPMTKFVLMSSTEREEEVVAAIASGASGHFPAGVSRSELLHAVRVAANGGSFFSRVAVERVLGRLRQLMESGPAPSPATLSVRERTILALIARGLTNEQIGQRQRVSSYTVRNNITGIRSKLGLHSRAKLVGYAYKHDLVEEPGEDMPEHGEGQ